MLHIISKICLSSITVFLCSVQFKFALSMSSFHQKPFSHSQKDGPSVDSTSVPFPHLVAHRGDNILFVENTIPAFESAILNEIDYVETDLVLTADGTLVCFHDINLKQWTDVQEREEFAHKMVPNMSLILENEPHDIRNDWLVSDFTLAELRTLKLKQEDKGIRSFYADLKVGIPTLAEFLETVHRYIGGKGRNQSSGKKDDFVVGIMVEIKYPSYHNNLFQEENFIERKLLKELMAFGYLNNSCKYQGKGISCSPLVIQSWEVDALKYLRKATDSDLLMVLDTNNLRYLTWAGMLELRGLANYIALHKNVVNPGTEAELRREGKSWNWEEMEGLGGFIKPHEMVEYIHQLGMKVGIYTIYHSEELDTNETKEEELMYYLKMGVDAIFVEGIGESVRIREKYLSSKSVMKTESESGRTWGMGKDAEDNGSDQRRENNGILEILVNLLKLLIRYLFQ